MAQDGLLWSLSAVEPTIPNGSFTMTNEPEPRSESVSEVLAEMTGRPASEFEADDHDFPDLDGLETAEID